MLGHAIVSGYSDSTVARKFGLSEEILGIEEACAGLPEVDLLHLRARRQVRLLPARGQPADRGTVFPSSDNSAVVYTIPLAAPEAVHLLESQGYWKIGLTLFYNVAETPRRRWMT